MPDWIQHLLVLTLVGACVIYAGWGALQTLVGKKSRLGSCCSKGCSSDPAVEKAGSGERMVFLPVELLRKSGK